MKSLFLSMLLLIAPPCLAVLTDQELDRMEQFDRWVHRAMTSARLETVPAIRALGRVLYEKSHVFPRAHAPADREIREFGFDGLTVYAVVEKTVPMPMPSRAWVTTIEIRSAAWPLDNGLHVGQEVAALARLPVQPDEGSLRFCGVNNCLIAEQQDGFISAITLETYLD